MFSLYGRTFKRGDANFVADFKTYVRGLYGLKLCTQVELDQEMAKLGEQGL
jgi:hypothetical protein